MNRLANNNKSHLNAEQKRKYILLRMIFIICMLIFAILFALFFYLQIRVLWIFNIFCFSILILNFFLIKKEKFLLSLQLTVLVIIAHSMFDSYCLGWKSNFWLYLITSGMIIVNSLSLKIKWKILEVVLFSALLIALYILTGNGSQVYTIRPEILEAISIYNIITAVFTLLFISFFNFMETDSLQKKLKDLSEIDSLTGAYNRRFFNHYLDIEIRRMVSQLQYKLDGRVNFGIAMLDVDNFKEINDQFGHLIGDNVLMDIARIVKSVLFERDILCRYGGDEFVILYTSTSREGAILANEKIRKIVDNHTFFLNQDHPMKHITISIGFANFDEEPDIYKLLDLADKRVYKAKKNGRNQVISD